MKKKAITLVLLALLVVGAIVPLSVAAAETWNYGYDKASMHDYSYYYHSGYSHYSTIYKNKFTWFAPVAKAGYWSKLNLEYSGPYRVSYNKYIVR